MMRNRFLYILVALLLSLMWPKAGSAQPHSPSPGVRDVVALAFVDLNGDGAFGLTETGMEPVLPNIEIRLYDDQPPTQSHGPEDILLNAASTNQDGYVVFRGLTTGNYLLVSALADGYLPTTPLVQSVVVDSNSQGTVLEYMFGQLPRNAFRSHIFFAAIGTP